MTIQFLRGNSRAPKGHAIFVARYANDPRQVLWTYCIATPMPLSMTKYLPPFLAAQMSSEDIQDVSNVSAMPLPPFMEEGSTFEGLQQAAEMRDDDFCEIGRLNPSDINERTQLAAQACGEYGQLYLEYSRSYKQSSTPLPAFSDEPAPLDDLDAEELLIQTMTDRQRLAELSKLVGLARYALEGRDTHLIDETRQRMQRIARQLPDKYRCNELINVATNPHERGSKLAELYIERGYKLLDEEYADIPNIELAIRKLQEQ